jgi:hypothetical protein
MSTTKFGNGSKLYTNSAARFNLGKEEKLEKEKLCMLLHTVGQATLLILLDNMSPPCLVPGSWAPEVNNSRLANVDAELGLSLPARLEISREHLPVRHATSEYW